MTQSKSVYVYAVNWYRSLTLFRFLIHLYLRALSDEALAHHGSFLTLLYFSTAASAFYLETILINWAGKSTEINVHVICLWSEHSNLELGQGKKWQAFAVSKTMIMVAGQEVNEVDSGCDLLC